MLKVDPGDRPSAEDLLVHRLPPLMVQFMEEEFALAEDTGDRGIANTRWVCHGRGVWWVCHGIQYCVLAVLIDSVCGQCVSVSPSILILHRSFLYHLDQTRRQLVPVNIHTKTKLEQVP